jgi:hypothetical protein
MTVLSVAERRCEIYAALGLPFSDAVSLSQRQGRLRKL